MAHKMQKILSFCAVLIMVLHSTFGDICESKMCEYTFDIHHAQTMTYRYKTRLHNVVINGTGLAPEIPNRFGRVLPSKVPIDEVITADGVQRNVLTINGKIPGPTIEVMEGAEVVVHVTNYLLTKAVSLHWHGMHQRGNPWMDGASYITQCPIIPGQSFTYRFIAYPPGTHWYHDHMANLRIDGLYGLFVVHAKLPTLPEKHLLLSDWYHIEADTMEMTFFGPLQGAGNYLMAKRNREYAPDNTYQSPYAFVSGLINGKGQFNNNNAPLTQFMFQSGDTYRYRTVCAAATYSFELSIDGHMLEIVALDGHEVNPFTVDSIIINPGESLDFRITADQPIDNYWMRTVILRLGTGINPVDDGVEKGGRAVVRYDQKSTAMPTTNKRACTAQNVCVIFNCPWGRFANGINKRCVQVDELQSVRPQRELDEEYGLSGPVDLELFLNIGNHIAAAINGMQYIHPTLPYSEPNYLEGHVTCDQPECNKPDKGCACTQVINLPFNKTVQFVMANLRPKLSVTHHPMHLHGHDFAVLKVVPGPINLTTGYSNGNHPPDLKCANSFCKDVSWNTQNRGLNLRSPPIRDTVNVPARGYTVVRFRTTNPGPWFFHCHLSHHVSQGMDLIFDEAHDRFPKTPKYFPRCPSFKWSEVDFQKYMAEDSANGEYESSDSQDDNDNDSNMNKPRQATEMDRTTKGPYTPPPVTDFLANNVVISNAYFIGVILGSIGVGAAIVLLVLLFVSCCRSKK